MFKQKKNILLILVQEYSDLNWELEGWSFLFCQLNYTLLKPPIVNMKTEKRWIEHPGVNTQYLANILPYQWLLFLSA